MNLLASTCITPRHPFKSENQIKKETQIRRTNLYGCIFESTLEIAPFRRCDARQQRRSLARTNPRLETEAATVALAMRCRIKQFDEAEIACCSVRSRRNDLTV